MNKMISLFVCMTLILLVVAVWGSRQTTVEPPVSEAVEDKQIYSTANPVSSQESNSEITVMADEFDTYLVKEYHGHIGIFRNGNKLPFQELDVAIETLPKADQLLLAHGITAETDAELQRILEDYES